MPKESGIKKYYIYKQNKQRLGTLIVCEIYLLVIDLQPSKGLTVKCLAYLQS